jgi:hypothetical protein
MTMIKIIRLFVIGGLLLIALGITERLNAAGNQARAGQEFTIKVGQQLKLDGADLALKFVAVPQDSRCPANVNCVWAGDAEVALESVHDKCTTALKLHTHQGSSTSNEGKVGAFRVKLVKLDPYPHTERKISPSDYVATLLVTKE